MTRETAIIILEYAMPNSSMGCGESDEKIEEAMNMAIKALKREAQSYYSKRNSDISNFDKIIADLKELDGRHLIGDYENERWIEIRISPMESEEE